MMELLEKAYLAGLGAFSVGREKAKEIVDELVEKGKITAEEAPKIMKDLMAKAEESKKIFEERIEAGIENALNRVNVASKKDIEALEKKLDLILKELKKS
jgi:polyhydroxyalkanoate synthesis regulator phasin